MTTSCSIKNRVTKFVLIDILVGFLHIMGATGDNVCHSGHHLLMAGRHFIENVVADIESRLSLAFREKVPPG
jgi:hypothetical protein